MTKRIRRDLGKGVRLVWHRSPDRVTRYDGYLRMRTLIANAIVAQMLPDGVVKGVTYNSLRTLTAA